MQFDWDLPKEQDNPGKHGVSFGDAQTSLFDLFVIRVADVEHSREN
jgi:uncharacterized DUF497 family protein